MAKLLHISPNIYPPLDGPHHHTKNIWKELAKGFDEYHILARSETNKYSFSQEGNIYLHLVPKITKKSKIFFFTSFWMFYIIKKYKITHLLSQCPIVGGFSASIASRFFKIPLMVEIHGEEYFRFFYNNSFVVPLMKFTFENAKKIRSLNQEMTNKLMSFVINKNKIVEIPNRVNLNIFNLPKENFKLHKPVKLISVGRFVKEKNYLNLIKALSESNIDFHLTLIGGGILKQQYLNLIKEKKLENKIKLIDWIEQKEMIKILRNADIYIQFSISEGMPRTIVEAMAMRLPIISTDVGSIKGVLVNKKNSIVIKPDKDELIKALHLLINNDSLRKNIALKAYKDVLEKYEWNKVFELYRNEIKSMKYGNP